MSLAMQVLSYIAVIVGGIVAGAAIVPGVVYVLSKSLPKGVRGVLGRILWTIAAIANGRNVLYQTETGRYVIHAVEECSGGGYQFTDGGETVQIDSSDTRWSRLGKQPFAVTYQKTDQAYGRWGDVVTTDGGDLSETRVEVDMARVMDHFKSAGGIGTLQRARRVAQRKFSGDGSLSTKWLAIAAVFAATAGGLTGLGLVVLM
jgi:hypothetical protein